MQFRKYVVFLAMMFAGSAFADARFSTDSAAPSGLVGLVYAQVQIENISESDMRRLVFYADRATHSLQNLVEGAGERSIIEQDKFNMRFRESVSRLADAGKRSGLSMDQVADFFTQAVFDTFGQSFMQQVGALAGGLDFRTLFRNVATVPDPRTNANDAGSTFLNALAQASQGLDLSVPLAQGSEVIITQVTPPPSAGPQPFPNATAAERDIVSRVRVVDGRWELTITQGDSLSEIASAIYGDTLSYTVIYSANNSVIANPNVIEVGTRLVLPQR